MSGSKDFANKPLAGLAALRDKLPPGPPAAEAPASGAEPPEAGAPTSSHVSKIVLRRERKKRGGKTITRVEGLDLRATDLSSLCKKLARALGCGSSLEGDDIVLQGDHVSRGARWFRDADYKNVVEGN